MLLVLIFIPNSLSFYSHCERAFKESRVLKDACGNIQGWIRIHIHSQIWHTLTITELWWRISDVFGTIFAVYFNLFIIKSWKKKRYSSNFISDSIEMRSGYQCEKKIEAIMQTVQRRGHWMNWNSSHECLCASLPLIPLALTPSFHTAIDLFV